MQNLMRQKSPILTYATPLEWMHHYSFHRKCKRVCSPLVAMLSADIDAITAEFTKVNNSNPLDAVYKFDIMEHDRLAIFFNFYRSLRNSLRKGREAIGPFNSHTQTAVPTNERPRSFSSSGGSNTRECH